MSASYLNNYYKIKKRKINDLDINIIYNIDYIELYLLKYFKKTTLNDIFKINSLSFLINNNTDLYIKYENLFKLLFNYDLNSILSNGSLKIEKLLNNIYSTKYSNYNNIHPKDIYQINLWFYLSNHIKPNVINDFINNDNYLSIKNKIINNTLSNNDMFNYSEIDFYYWYDRNIKFDHNILNGYLYFIIPYNINIKFKKNINIEVNNIFDKTYNILTNINDLNLKGGDLILFKDNITNDDIISINRINYI